MSSVLLLLPADISGSAGLDQSDGDRRRGAPGQDQDREEQLPKGDGAGRRRRGPVLPAEAGADPPEVDLLQDPALHRLEDVAVEELGELRVLPEAEAEVRRWKVRHKAVPYEQARINYVGVDGEVHGPGVLLHYGCHAVQVACRIDEPHLGRISLYLCS